MKILYVDTSIDGHHLPYIKALAYREKNRCSVVIPESVPELAGIDQFVVRENVRSLRGYLSWIESVRKIAKNGNYQIIHFVYGDVMYRFFGLGLGRLSDFKLIATFHQIRYSFLRKVSIKRLFKKLNIGVVHTKSLRLYLKQCGISNCTEVTYPVFESISELDDEQRRNIRHQSSIQDKDKVLLALGGTRYDKGLDILLVALQNIKENFTLIVAGQESDIKRKQIDEESSLYSDSVRLQLRYLSEHEISDLVNIADIIVLPYRKVFDGASGPLGLGVLGMNQIIGPSHGSLGQIIRDNHLGSVFEAENSENLAEILERALRTPFEADSKYLSYRGRLSPEKFADAYHNLFREMIN
ncbi:glycosyltransferase family 4 protein [Lacticaseibacillus kribbianus]|uniref:glycosyltransferase family 4 protein n=1 Tax=Lacticaseibacillus kribbianus TaxID=2926292 RepID=UPI001CD3EED9|nr:glycosyltransferase family 4 protein [Lacticaseibacillus kribbianus]